MINKVIIIIIIIISSVSQLIWNMKTNVFTDEEALHKDPEIGAHLENLIDRITNSLLGTALDFYKREFDFFDKVTSISGTIR